MSAPATSRARHPAGPPAAAAATAAARWLRARAGLAVVALVLLAVAGLAFALVREATRTAALHRAALDQARQHYAAIAAWGFARSVREVLLASAVHTLDSVRAGPVRADAERGGPGTLVSPPPRDLVHGDTTCGCGRRFPVTFAFRAGPGGRVDATTAGAPPPPVLDALAPAAWRIAVRADSLRRARDGAPPPGTAPAPALFRAPVGGGPRTFAARLVRDPAGRAAGVVAAALDSGALASTVARALGGAPLLPARLTGGRPNAALLGVALVDAGGRALFATAGDTAARVAADPVAGRDTLGARLPGLEVVVRFRAAGAAGLVVEAPRPLAPALAALLALALAVLAAAVAQLRRGAALARARADFVANVSHELRTPLAQISLFGETLLAERTRTDAERRRFVGGIVREARRLTLLVEDVLRFAPGHPAARPGPTPVCLAGELRDAVEFFAPLATARGARGAARLDDALWAAADRHALRQLVLNLLDNAVKYGPAGQTVTLALARADAPGGRGGGAARARLTVDDEGPGVPAALRARVFAPFVRLPAADAVAGSGIGLAVVRDVARAHGGAAWVEDAPGGGACFVVELPLAAPPAGASGDAPDAAAAVAAGGIMAGAPAAAAAAPGRA